MLFSAEQKARGRRNSKETGKGIAYRDLSSDTIAPSGDSGNNISSTKEDVAVESSDEAGDEETKKNPLGVFNEKYFYGHC